MLKNVRIATLSANSATSKVQTYWVSVMKKRDAQCQTWKYGVLEEAKPSF